MKESDPPIFRILRMNDSISGHAVPPSLCITFWHMRWIPSPTLLPLSHVTLRTDSGYLQFVSAVDTSITGPSLSFPLLTLTSTGLTIIATDVHTSTMCNVK